jgi:hypothetical protein
MQWTVVADVLRALAAGLTAVIATIKFIYDIRHRKNQPDEKEENDETLPNEPTAEADNTESTRK